ncbi:hypothetical protein Tco_0809303 [Tanacetum coccineum]
MNSTLEDPVDKNSLDDNLDDTISEMFTNEHALDYSSPPLWDNYDDQLFDLETINDDTYDDPLYSKEEKIKDAKLLIDELDPPRSSDFLPFPEYCCVSVEGGKERWVESRAALRALVCVECGLRLCGCGSGKAARGALYEMERRKGLCGAEWGVGSSVEWEGVGVRVVGQKERKRVVGSV